ncbi:mycothiol synthase [Corynebacterium breve]|uniref:Mycothiol acetyltransferase n=1 Tax=Corynebacterium breve TaxID=3049799 RepID=A0ABY8VCD7_9CORY|nr:mycothiol synthase [Corynebacterium breve]WIM67306.1 mycothiol synthase [Corynebacterium breve]
MTNSEILSLQLPQHADQRQRALALIERAECHDKVAPFSEAFLRGLGDEALAHQHLVVEDKAVAALAPDGGVELVVAPDARRQGLASEILSRVLEQRSDASVWAHGNLPAAAATARKHGLEVARRLLVMAVDGPAFDAAAEMPGLSDGFEALDYPAAVKRWGVEAVDNAWLNTNNEAFSWHPEQGGWDIARLHQGMDTDWFDPHGVLFLYQGSELAGFHWTKQHPGGVGEVYVVGLSSAFRGKGLGDPLLRMGLSHLKKDGATRVILYVEADNAPAVARYEDLGFKIAEDHVAYQLNA